MLNRRTGSAPPKYDDESGRKPRKPWRRLTVLWWWAAIFTVVMAVVMVAATTLGFGRNGLYWVPVALVVFVVVGSANGWTVYAADRRAPSWSPLWTFVRLFVGLCLAAVVAYAGILCQFRAGIENSRHESVARWDTEVVRLDGELAAAAGIASRPVSTVDGDLRVQELTAALAEQRRKSEQANENALCERAGTCGTYVEGRGEAYYGREAYAVEMAAKVKALEKELEAVRGAVALRIERENRERTEAATRIGDVQAEREKLGQRPEPRSQFDGVTAVAQERVGAVGGWSVGLFAACLAVDVGAFLFIVWRVCNGERTR